jgi:hypothetical protein
VRGLRLLGPRQTYLAPKPCNHSSGPRWVERKIASCVNGCGLSPKEFPRWPIPPGRQEWVLDTQFLLRAPTNERAIMARSWAWAVEPE